MKQQLFNLVGVLVGDNGVSPKVFIPLAKQL